MRGIIRTLLVAAGFAASVSAQTYSVSPLCSITQTGAPQSPSAEVSVQRVYVEGDTYSADIYFRLILPNDPEFTFTPNTFNFAPSWDPTTSNWQTICGFDEDCTPVEQGIVFTAHDIPITDNEFNGMYIMSSVLKSMGEFEVWGELTFFFIGCGVPADDEQLYIYEVLQVAPAGSLVLATATSSASTTTSVSIFQPTSTFTPSTTTPETVLPQTTSQGNVVTRTTTITINPTSCITLTLTETAGPATVVQTADGVTVFV